MTVSPAAFIAEMPRRWRHQWDRLATARRFAGEGAQVVVTGRRQESLEKALAAFDRPVSGVRGDVSDLADLGS